MLFEAVGAGAEEFEEVEVAEDLKLLAAFVGDVAPSRTHGARPAQLGTG